MEKRVNHPSLEEMETEMVKELTYWKVDVVYLCVVGRGEKKVWKILDETEYHKPYTPGYTSKAEDWGNGDIRVSRA